MKTKLEKALKLLFSLFWKHMQFLDEISSFCWNNFLGPRWSCSCLGAMSATRSLGNFCVPMNTLLEQKLMHPVSQPQARPALVSLLTSFLRLTTERWVCSPSQSSTFYFSLPCSLSYKSFLSSSSWWGSSKRDCPLHEGLNKVCLYHLNCLL